jgi:hypothetical protein
MTVERAAALREPFPPEAIGKLPKGGAQLDYVGHAATTDRLLMVDPSWSWEPFALDERGLPALDEEGNLWIRLTILGVTRPGVGDGQTMKIRIGDALRNAAMRFGVALDLWAKEDLHEVRQAGDERQRLRESEDLYRAVADAGRADPEVAARWKAFALMHDRQLTVPAFHSDSEWREAVAVELLRATPGEVLADALDGDDA